MIVRCKTDKGKIRDINEDYVLTLKSNDYVLLIIADGMGGHNAGEIASRIASITMRDYIFTNFSFYKDKEELVRDAILKSNMEVYNYSKSDEKLSGMGTTISSCLVYTNEVYIGHVGDSRIYVINKDEIKRVTEDHSFVQELINNGSITEVEAINHPQRNLITRAIGTERHVNVDTKVIKIKSGESLLLCSDGLTSYLSNEEIMNTILKYKEDSVEVLIREANNRGGKDNISVIIARKED